MSQNLSDQILAKFKQGEKGINQHGATHDIRNSKQNKTLPIRKLIVQKSTTKPTLQDKVKF